MKDIYFRKEQIKQDEDGSYYLILSYKDKGYKVTASTKKDLFQIANDRYRKLVFHDTKPRPTIQISEQGDGKFMFAFTYLGEFYRGYDYDDYKEAFSYGIKAWYRLI